MQTNVVSDNKLETHGFIMCTYDTLTSVFGFPNELSNTKAIWNVQNNLIKIVGNTSTDDSSIYDQTDWCICGLFNDSVDIVKSIADAKLGTYFKYLAKYDILKYY